MFAINNIFVIEHHGIFAVNLEGTQGVDCHFYIKIIFYPTIIYVKKFLRIYIHKK
jgi:hypothetical protein